MCEGRTERQNRVDRIETLVLRCDEVIISFKRFPNGFYVAMARRSQKKK